MPNIRKFNELAKALGLQYAQITMPIKQGTLIAHDEKAKTIDVDLPHNIVWINKQLAKGRILDWNRANKKGIHQVQPLNAEKKEEKTKKKKTNRDELGILELEIEKKRKELRKLDNEDKIQSIRIQKMEGELMPFEDVKNLFLYHMENIRSTYLQEVRGLADIFKQRFGGTDLEYVLLQKDLTEKINDLIDESVDVSLKDVDEMRMDYSEVRGRGEKI